MRLANGKTQRGAPNIHKDLDQDRVVHRRLLPGDPFTPRKAANGEEEEE